MGRRILASKLGREETRSTRRVLSALLRGVAVALPWLLSLFFLYAMEHRGYWNVEQDYRSVVSVLVLAMGMGLSLTVFSVIRRNRR